MNTPETETHICKSCGNTFVGTYCNLCGEKVLQTSDRKLKSLFSNVLIAITFADNKFIKTLWLVIKEPGFLSSEYVNGIRVKYVRPLQLFFILNLIYFLFPVFQLFNSSLFTQMYLLPHRTIVRELVLKKLDSTSMSLQAYTLMYDAKSQSLAKLLIVVFIVIASVPMSIIYRKKKLYFTDHTALAVELASFNLAINALLLSVIFWTLNTAFNWAESGWIQYLDDLAITVIFVITNTYFLWRASKTFYDQRKLTRHLKVFFGLIGLYLSLEVYRLLLFFVTFYSV